METKPAGSLWLQKKLRLDNFWLTHHSFIGDNAKIEVRSNGAIIQVYGPKYNINNETPLKHVEFSLKYDHLHLSFLKAVFEKISDSEIVSHIANAPTSKYSHKIGFLYEFLLQKKLPITFSISGNYVDLLDREKYITCNHIYKNARWRINDNLLGTAFFCPVVRKTKALDELLLLNIKDQIDLLKAEYSPDIFRRAASYLYSKETSSSYEIEKEKPSPERMERFIALLIKAGNGQGYEILSESSLTILQNAIVDPRFAAKGFRDFQNYIGQTLPNHTQRIHYVCPPPHELTSLMTGLKDCADKTFGIHAAVRASIISFGFVFIHPFEDGNGRIHRFLIHDVLVRGKAVPEGVIIPVSAHMLNNIKEYDEILENYSKPLMQQIQYSTNAEGEIQVTNPEQIISYYRYPDLTAQCIFLAQTIQATITNDMPDELKFIVCYGELKKEIQNIVDMPGKYVSQMIIFLHNNRGIFPKRRRKDFEKLTDEEITNMENVYREIFKTQ